MQKSDTMLMNLDDIAVSTEELFKQDPYVGLSYDEAWSLALENGWRWDIQRGCWYRIVGY
jgi:hypothetical protein